jgi:hypothetical protein
MSLGMISPLKLRSLKYYLNKIEKIKIKLT